MVSVLIPRIDRSGVDFRRLPGMICSISDHSGEIFYRVLTAYGILNDGYRVSDLEPYCGIVDVAVHEEANVQISRFLTVRSHAMTTRFNLTQRTGL